MAKRDTFRYKLLDDGRVVYYGITDDPERRREEHKEDGKDFDSMNITRPVVTEKSAEKWEEERLEDYRKRHSGRNPRYNKTDK
jgi:predicted GIY-YIG superfamily endonuclease